MELQPTMPVEVAAVLASFITHLPLAALEVREVAVQVMPIPQVTPEQLTPEVVEAEGAQMLAAKAVQAVQG